MSKIKFFVIAVIILIVAGLIFLKFKGKSSPKESTQEFVPTIGAIQSVISTTGTVLPKNRLQIKPPVNGRIESILAVEGQDVKLGETLAWMSSTERAALLDAARGQSEEKLKYWQEAYKPIALLAPINGQVIVATTQPGQTVTTSEAVVVLSDQLIVRAQVDETDIGKIRLGQEAIIVLDAYPDKKIKAGVEHIYYESQTVNNVTIYNVDLLPKEVPQFFRSGMNATVDFIEKSKDDALLVPVEAVHKDKKEAFVLLKSDQGKEPVKQMIQLGMTDDKNYEVISGLTINDRIVINVKKFSLPGGSLGSNPFSPFGQTQKKKTN
ncbi:MAG: efflux RND transporter periplasmic adaptor subunit [Candidatus Omnitrophica bacterium]|nr:efflux RND transporter periplasmic adaptor subunit [Candidatus Omnitrophota bacterium]